MLEIFTEWLKNSHFKPELPAAGFMGMMAFLAFFKGVLKQFLSLLSAAAGLFAGWWGFREAPEMMNGAINSLSPNWLYGISAACGGAIFMVMRVMGNWVIEAFGFVNGITRLFGRRRGFGMTGSLLSLIPSSFLVLGASSALKFGGDVSRIDRTEKLLAGDKAAYTQQENPLAIFAEKLDQSAIGSLLNKSGQTQRDAEVKLVEILLLSHEPSVWQKLNNDPSFHEIVEHETMSNLLNNSSIRDASRRGNHAYLLNQKRIRRAAADKSISLLLSRVSLDKIIKGQL